MLVPSRYRTQKRPELFLFGSKNRMMDTNAGIVFCSSLPTDMEK